MNCFCRITSFPNILIRVLIPLILVFPLPTIHPMVVFILLKFIFYTVGVLSTIIRLISIFLVHILLIGSLISSSAALIILHCHFGVTPYQLFEGLWILEILELLFVGLRFLLFFKDFSEDLVKILWFVLVLFLLGFSLCVLLLLFEYWFFHLLHFTPDFVWWGSVFSAVMTVFPSTIPICSDTWLFFIVFIHETIFYCRCKKIIYPFHCFSFLFFQLTNLDIGVTRSSFTWVVFFSTRNPLRFLIFLNRT